MADLKVDLLSKGEPLFLQSVLDAHTRHLGEGDSSSKGCISSTLTLKVCKECHNRLQALLLHEALVAEPPGPDTFKGSEFKMKSPVPAS